MAETPAKQHVVIVGGGIIGLCSAHALLRDGHSVTIIEQDHLGAGAATGNAGEVTPIQVAPLASPSMAKDVIRGVFTGKHYLAIDFTKLPHLAFWGLDFILASMKGRMAKGNAALGQFAGDILPALDRLKDSGIDVSGSQNDGFLMIASDEELLTSTHANYEARAAKGWGTPPGPIMRGEELHKFEPTLSPDIKGGYLLPAERSLDPITFIQSLIDDLTKRGVEMRVGLSAEKLGSDGKSVVCKDENGSTVTVSGDKVVLAAGAWTSKMLKNSGVKHKKVVPGKGYSFTVPVEKMPAHLIHSKDRNAVLIPMHDRLRVVGMMDFDQNPTKFDARRIEVLKKAASTVITGADWENITDEWVGPRPMTSDGLPLLGAVSGMPNVIVCAGHNMHGLSLGPIHGEVVADLVAGREVKTGEGKKVDMQPFAVRR